MKMHKYLPSRLLSLSCLLLPALAAADDFGPDHDQLARDRQRAETTGIFGGAVLGGVIAGPPGAIAMAMLGAIVGDGHSSHREKKATETSLQQLGQQFSSLEVSNASLKRDYAELENNYYALRRDHETRANDCCFDSQLVLHFRTGSSDIAPHYLDELQVFAEATGSRDGARIELTGYADQRGDSDSNMALSHQRLQAVTTALSSLGLDRMQIRSTAYGETRPLDSDGSAESLFYDRRVVIRASIPDSQYLGQLTH